MSDESVWFCGECEKRFDSEETLDNHKCKSKKPESVVLTRKAIEKKKKKVGVIPNDLGRDGEGGSTTGMTEACQVLTRDINRVRTPRRLKLTNVVMKRVREEREVDKVYNTHLMKAYQGSVQEQCRFLAALLDVVPKY